MPGAYSKERQCVPQIKEPVGGVLGVADRRQVDTAADFACALHSGLARAAQR